MAALLAIAGAPVAALAAVAVTTRWATTSLPAIAGIQAVLGPAVVVGPVRAALATFAAATAIALSPDRRLIVPSGLLAGVVACGPAAVTPGLFALRGLGAVAGIGVAWVAADRVPRLAALPIAVVAVAAAFPMTRPVVERHDLVISGVVAVATGLVVQVSASAWGYWVRQE